MSPWFSTGTVCRGVDRTVDLAGLESFPASDPPAWSPTVVGAPAAGRTRGPQLLHEVDQGLRDAIHLLGGVNVDPSDASPRARARARARAERAAVLVEQRLRDAGLPVKRRPSGTNPASVEAVILGRRPNDSVVVAASYAARRPPAADDDPAGVAALLALSVLLQEKPLRRTVRLVAFLKEEREPPGSAAARYIDQLLRAGPRVSAMVNLDALGIRPPLGWPLRHLAPLRSGLLVFGGGLGSRHLVERARGAFSRAAPGIAVRALSLPFGLPLRSSDQRAFARRGIPAFTVTDYGPPDRLDYDRLGRVTMALAAMVGELAGAKGR